LRTLTQRQPVNRFQVPNGVLTTDSRSHFDHNIFYERRTNIFREKVSYDLQFTYKTGQFYITIIIPDPTIDQETSRLSDLQKSIF